jgi:hypothetical protein
MMFPVGLVWGWVLVITLQETKLVVAKIPQVSTDQLELKFISDKKNSSA